MGICEVFKHSSTLKYRVGVVSQCRKFTRTCLITTIIDKPVKRLYLSSINIR